MTFFCSLRSRTSILLSSNLALFQSVIASVASSVGGTRDVTALQLDLKAPKGIKTKANTAFCADDTAVLPLLPYSKKVVGSNTGLCNLCVEFACSHRVCVGSVRVRRLSQGVALGSGSMLVRWFCAKLYRLYAGSRCHHCVCEAEGGRGRAS